MGIFDWLLGGKKEVKTAMEIQTHELKNQLLLLKKAKFADLYKEFEVYGKDMLGVIDGLDKDAIVLSMAQKGPNEVDPRILVRLNSAKYNLTNKVRFLCKNYHEKLMPVASFSDIKLFLGLIEYTIQEVNKTAKYSEISAIAFKREVNNIALKVKKVIDIYKAAKKNFDESNIADFESLENNVKNLFDIMEYRKKIEEEIREQKKELIMEMAKLNKLHTELTTIEHSTEYKGAKDLMQKIEELETDLKNLKITLRNKFGDFSKAITKAKYSGSFTDEEKRLMDLYLAEPLDAIDIDYELKMNLLLERIKAETENRTVELDNRMRSKAVKSITHFLKNDELKVAVSEKRDILEEINMIEDEIKKAGIHNFHTLNTEIDTTQKRVNGLEIALQVQDELLKKNMAGIEQLKKGITELFSSFGIDVKID